MADEDQDIFGEKSAVTTPPEEEEDDLFGEKKDKSTLPESSPVELPSEQPTPPLEELDLNDDKDKDKKDNDDPSPITKVDTSPSNAGKSEEVRTVWFINIYI